MKDRATEVVRLLEELRRMNLPEAERNQIESLSASALGSAPPEEYRPPKRPWEDMSQDGVGASGQDPGVFNNNEVYFYFISLVVQSFIVSFLFCFVIS